MTTPITCAIERAREAWGSSMPDWVLALAQACDEPGSSQAQLAKRISYSGTVINRVLSNTYAGNLKRVEAKVRGALLSATVACPVLGEISRLRCVNEQGKSLSARNPVAVRLFNACHGGCPNFIGDGK